MNRHILSLALSLAALSLWAQDGPTMGWSSWNTYGVNISDALIRSQADAMVSTGLKDAGYNHINIDDGFFGGRNTQTGELLIHPTRFPNGLKPVADYIELQPVPNPQGIGEVWEKVSEGASSKAWSPDGRPATPQSPLRIERGRKFFKK